MKEAMTPERWKQIEEIYYRAKEHDARARPAFLDEACGADEELRRQVESLLTSDDEAEDFLEAPAMDLAAQMIADDQPPSLAGKQIGHYEILVQIGAGGMGEVYRARDTRLGREVAVKVLPAHLSQNREALARFEREAKVVATLSHPNILAIHDFGTEDGVCFAVMELLEGETLRESLVRSALSWHQAVRIGAAVADGLAAAHTKGIIHRDLKPENIFLVADGAVKILDFGLARIKAAGSAADESTASSRSMTEPGVVMGTVSYMSPEQVRGEKVDTPSDIFSLGCVLHEMVTGQRTFRRQTAAETMAAILRDEPLKLSDTSTDVPPQLEGVITRCLKKDGKERYQSTSDLVSDLKRVLNASEVSSSTQPRAPGRRSSATWIAILPLANASGDKDAEYLSDGITESLINSLSQLPRLRVVARASVFRYKGLEIDPRQAGLELGVRAVVMGRVAQRADMLSIQVDLVDVATGRQLWGEQYHRELTDILKVQEDVATHISQRLRIKLGGGQRKLLTKRHTQSPEAYKLYLKGRFYWNKFTEEDLRKSIEYFSEALNKDPGYALAYAGLAYSHSVLGANHLYPKEHFPKAEAYAEKAKELDETLAQSHVALGAGELFYKWDWLAAERELKRAIELNANDADAYDLYGYLLEVSARASEAIIHIKQALEIDPLSPLLNTDLGWAYHYERRYDQAIAQCREAIQLDANFHLAYYVAGQSWIQKGQYEQAIEVLKKAHAMSAGWPAVAAELAYAYASTGQPGQAEKLLHELRERAKQGYLDPYYLAIVYLGLADRDQTCVWLEKACDERSPRMPWLGVEPKFDRLRSDPRFTDVLRRVGLSP